MQKKEHIAFVFAHIALFIVFVWFGALKVLGFSPAGPMVADLFNNTLGIVVPFLTPDTFIILFGYFEVLIGILFVIPRMEKIAIGLLIPHMITTLLPLIFLPQMTWQGFLVPTLEGQYIIKNVIVIALVAMVFADVNKSRKQLS